MKSKKLTKAEQEWKDSVLKKVMKNSLSKKTNFDGIKDRTAKWPNEVYSRKEKPTGMLNCILLALAIWGVIFLFIGQDYIIHFFTK